MQRFSVPAPGALAIHGARHARPHLGLGREQRRVTADYWTGRRARSDIALCSPLRRTRHGRCTIIVEQTFDPPLTPEAFSRLAARIEPCLEQWRVSGSGII